MRRGEDHHHSVVQRRHARYAGDYLNRQLFLLVQNLRLRKLRYQTMRFRRNAGKQAFHN